MTEVLLADALGGAEVFTDGDWVESKDQDPNGDVRLVQLADVGVGTYLDKSARFMMSGKAARLRCTYLQAGDVLVARMPDPLGRACVFPGDLKPSVTVVDVCVIRTDQEAIDSRWLMHWFNSEGASRSMERSATGTTRKRISRSNLGKLRIPIPPIEEQRRIAAVLDAADALRAKRRQALAKLDTLTQAIFIDMLSAVGWGAWPDVTVSALAASAKGSIRTGPFGSQLLHEEFVDEGTAVLGIDNAVNNRFEWAERRFITEQKYAQLRRYTVFPGDVLVTIMGTCGRVAIVPQDIPVAINTKHLCCVTLERSLCLPEWLWACLRFHPQVRRQLGATHGAVMPGLNMGKIKQAEIPVPPMSIQERFVEMKERVESEFESASASEARLDELFASLQQRAFRGEL